MLVFLEQSEIYYKVEAGHIPVDTGCHHNRMRRLDMSQFVEYVKKYFVFFM